jgi:threonine/homoserine/homoserine lactone efflux protein
MYPAAQQTTALIAVVAVVFSVITVLTMLACVAATTIGLEKLKLPTTGRYSQAVAGAAVLACGVAITFMGL